MHEAALLRDESAEGGSVGEVARAGCRAAAERSECGGVLLRRVHADSPNPLLPIKARLLRISSRSAESSISVYAKSPRRIGIGCCAAPRAATPGIRYCHRLARNRITLEVYTQAVTWQKRAAQSKVVRMMVPGMGTSKISIIRGLLCPYRAWILLSL